MYQARKFVTTGSYKSFSPALLSEGVDFADKQIPTLLAEAMRYLGELNAYSQLVPDIDYFIRMHIAKEATTSSKIEGTVTSLAEALMGEAEFETAEKRDDWEEVQNYIKAINFAILQLEKLPLANRLICETHKVLLSGVRGFTKAPGQIRKTQNQIGGSPGDISTAVFVPPSPEKLGKLMTDLEQYWHTSDPSTPMLIKIAVMHYQFETIHPFLDGNGRVGRLLIPLQLIERGVLVQPTLYLSDYFERNRSSYYDALDRVRTADDIDHWIKFFLSGVAETARDASQTLKDVVSLKERYLERIGNEIPPRRQINGRKLLPMLFAQPIVTVAQIEEMLGSSTQTANLIANEFTEIGLFRELTGYKKNRKFVLGEYFDLFNKPRKAK